MKRKAGYYITQKITGESFRAYVPSPLPLNQFHPSLDWEVLFPLFEKATAKLAELKSLQQHIPNPNLFLYSYVRKEALLSSQIEGTQSSFSDLILFEHDQKTTVSLEDVEEVSHYVKALSYAIERIQAGFPLSLRLLREIHHILLQGSRGKEKESGEFRRSQNWIGGTRPGNALFVPPPPEELPRLLGNLEIFLHESNLPPLLKAGIAHLQLETLHPFLDGNGRLGRLLISLLLTVEGTLEEPILYLSLYLKEHRSLYYQLLQEVRTNGDWEKWLTFFLEGVIYSAQDGISTIEKMEQLFKNDQAIITTLGRARFSCQEAWEYMKQLPQITAPLLAKGLSITPPTARVVLMKLEKVGILEEISGKKRDKIYIYRDYLTLLEKGTEPL